MENVYSRADAHGRSPPLQARPAACLHSPPRTPRDARMPALARPGARDDTLTPRALRAARRARLRELAPCAGPAPRLPTRGNNSRRCSLPRSARMRTPPPGATRLPHGVLPAEPPGSPAAPPVRCQRPAPCTPPMGGAGWADPLPAVRAALRACGLRLAHHRVAGGGSCSLHALACAAGTTASERASVGCASLADLAVRQLKITAFVEWSTAKSCELLMLCRHLLRGLVVCDVMTDCYPV